jgi:DNA-binding CsgD family transcriptional regulator
MPARPPAPSPADDAEFESPASPADYFPEITPAEGRTLDAETFRIADRRLAVVRLYRRGLSMAAIAREVKCSPGTVHSDIHAVLDNVKRQAARTARDHLADALQRLTDRECELERDLERSRGEFVETVAGRRVVGTGAVDATSVKKKTRYGDPKLHALLVKCWELRCQLLGLLADAKTDPGSVPVKLVSGIDPAELV